MDVVLIAKLIGDLFVRRFHLVLTARALKDVLIVFVSHLMPGRMLGSYMMMLRLHSITRLF